VPCGSNNPGQFCCNEITTENFETFGVLGAVRRRDPLQHAALIASAIASSVLSAHIKNRRRNPRFESTESGSEVNRLINSLFGERLLALMFQGRER
jgi:hypothetical protein